MAHDVFPDTNFDWSIMPRKRKQLLNNMVNEDQECDEKVVANEIEEKNIELNKISPSLKKKLSEQIDISGGKPISIISHMVVRHTMSI